MSLTVLTGMEFFSQDRCLELGAQRNTVLSNSLVVPMVSGDLVQRPGDGDLGFSRNIFAISMPNSGEEGCIRLLLGAEMLQSGAGEIAFRKNLVVAPNYDLILFFHPLFFVVILRLLLVALVF